jgi:hypothetical protein
LLEIPIGLNKVIDTGQAHRENLIFIYGGIDGARCNNLLPRRLWLLETW